MAGFATTKLSSKGQVVIPEEIRADLGLKEGAQFVVIGKGDTVILKTISPPSLDDVKSLLDKAKAQARGAHLKKSDAKRALAKLRQGR